MRALAGSYLYYNAKWQPGAAQWVSFVKKELEGWVTPYNELYGEASPERGPL